jgi:hypothetical protein
MIHDGHLFVLAVYVDECLLIGNQSKFLTLLKYEFSSRFKIEEDLGLTTWILGCSIIRKRSRGTLRLVQNRYLKDLLQEFGMSECTPMSTPMSAKPSKSVSIVLYEEEMPYAKLIGKLLYAFNFARLDITASVNYLSRYMSHPGVEHWLRTKRLLRYLKGTLDKGLTFNRIVPYTLVAWQDSSFADGLDGKSRTWYAVLVCGSAVAWGFRLQPTVALSTMEDEYMALYAATHEVMFLRQLLVELSLVLKHSTSMM